jgi:hypothetical protein
VPSPPPVMNPRQHLPMADPVSVIGVAGRIGEFSVAAVDGHEHHGVVHGVSTDLTLRERTGARSIVQGHATTPSR